MSVWDVKLRNHSRERSPYISKLLDEAYNGIWLSVAFPTERRRVPCAVQNAPPCTFYACESRCWYTKRQEWTVVTHPVNHPLHVH
jgi:hypothetical protein